MCVQRKAKKVNVQEEDLIRSNIAGFGDEIGRTTNFITSMFGVQSRFPPGSEEYETLDYRIKSGQNFQQNCIDKQKGIIFRPMPRYWYDYHANKLGDNPTDEDIARRELNLRILADKKPYFMRYIYPNLMKQYNTYIKNTNIKCGREFRMDVATLLAIDPSERTERQNEFIRYYQSRMPVGMDDCIMNKICRRFEAEFDGFIQRSASKEDFDYSILKSDATYTAQQYNAIAKLYAQHNESLRAYKQSQMISRDSDTYDGVRENTTRMFIEECHKICNNSAQLCNIVVDLCYRKIGSQQFAWDVCGEQIVNNLLEKNGYMISFPVRDDEGDILYRGSRFSMTRKESKRARDNSERETVGGGCTGEQHIGDEAV